MSVDDHEAACRAERAPPQSTPALTSADVEAAFDTWWKERGYPEPECTVGPNASAIAWDAYHVRYGLAWNAFQAGVRAALEDREKGGGS